MNTFQVECLIYILTLVLLTLFSVKEIREIIYDIINRIYNLLRYILNYIIINIKRLVQCIRRIFVVKNNPSNNPIENYNQPIQEKLIQLNPITTYNPSYEKL